MKKIDELILKLLQLKPNMIFEKSSNSTYHLMYKNITFRFNNMNYERLAIVKINNGENISINDKTRLSVLEYFDKSYEIEELLRIVNKDLRKEKLLSIKEKII